MRSFFFFFSFSLICFSLLLLCTYTHAHIPVLSLSLSASLPLSLYLSPDTAGDLIPRRSSANFARRVASASQADVEFACGGSNYRSATVPRRVCRKAVPYEANSARHHCCLAHRRPNEQGQTRKRKRKKKQQKKEEQRGERKKQEKRKCAITADVIGERAELERRTRFARR